MCMHAYEYNYESECHFVSYSCGQSLTFTFDNIGDIYKSFCFVLMVCGLTSCQPKLKQFFKDMQSDKNLSDTM